MIEKFAPPITDQRALLARAARVGANALLLGLWFWLYWPVFDYLSVIFSREDFRTNQILLVGVIVLIVAQVRKGGIYPQIDALPQLYRPALVLALGGSLLYLAVERFLDVNTLSASLFGLASYGLLGLWMGGGADGNVASRWRQGLPALLLLIGTLPFGEHMQTFIGYPMRILTAAIVRDGLTAAGVASVGIDTILVLENGVSKVDLPCSGVKSLWTGMLFLISATWIERRPLNLRWLLIASVFAGLLFVANLARVGVLVVVGQVAGWRLMAEMLHVPLGVLGFVGACAAAVALLRHVGAIPRGRPDVGTPDVGAIPRGCPDVGAIPRGCPDVGAIPRGCPDVGTPDVGAIPRGCLDVGTPDVGAIPRGCLDVGAMPPGWPDVDVGAIPARGNPHVGAIPSGRPLGRGALWAKALPLHIAGRPLGKRQPRHIADRPIWLVPALALTIAAMGFVYTPRAHSGLAQQPPEWRFAADLVTEPMPLKPDEIEWLTRDGAESADRRRFEWRGISGSMILISSTTWRAHHRPERCFEVYGLSLDESRTHLVNPDFPLRFVSLGDGAGSGLLSATYWFQSADYTTDDYATRIWADLAPQRARWVLVSILFDDAYEPQTTDLNALYNALHQAVARQLM